MNRVLSAIGVPSAMAAHNVYHRQPEDRTYFLSEIDKILKTVPEIRDEVFRPKDEMLGIRRTIAQVVVSKKLIDDQSIIQRVPKEKQPLLKGLVNCLQVINGQTGLGTEVARRGTEAAVLAHTVHKDLEKFNDPEALEEWNNFKTQFTGGKTRIKKKYKRHTRCLSKHTRK